MLGALNRYDKDLLREYQYRLLKCFESAQKITDDDYDDDDDNDDDDDDDDNELFLWYG